MRRVTTLDEFLPYSALSVMTDDDGERVGAVPDTYTVYAKDATRAITSVKFQSRPFREGANGLTIETLLAITLDRLHLFQQGPLACAENEQVIHKVEEALMWMRLRIDRKIMRGTYGRMP